VLRELAKVYARVFKPIEEATKFDVFYSSLLNEAEFRTPPMAPRRVETEGCVCPRRASRSALSDARRGGLLSSKFGQHRTQKTLHPF